MNIEKINQYGDELYEALLKRQQISPLTDREPTITVEDAYSISQRFLARRQQTGERVIGKKIGLTSKVVMNMLNVREPDFGFLTDRMSARSGAELPISREMIQPRAEGEIAFRRRKALRGPGVTMEQVLDATESVHPCFEIVDSRIRDWKIKIQDTVADNASSGMFVLSDDAADPRKIDLITCGMVVWKNGEVLSTGAGAAALGSPLASVAWLANTLGTFGASLEAGDIVLSGALVPLESVKPGDNMVVQIAGIGRASVNFV